MSAQFVVPKLENVKQCPLQWSPDETVCLRIIAEKSGKLVKMTMLRGHDLMGEPLEEIEEARAAMVAEWWGVPYICHRCGFFRDEFFSCPVYKSCFPNVNGP